MAENNHQRNSKWILTDLCSHSMSWSVNRSRGSKCWYRSVNKWSVLHLNECTHRKLLKLGCHFRYKLNKGSLNIVYRAAVGGLFTCWIIYSSPCCCVLNHIQNIYLQIHVTTNIRNLVQCLFAVDTGQGCSLAYTNFCTHLTYTNFCTVLQWFQNKWLCRVLSS